MARYFPEMHEDSVRQKSKLIVFVSKECSICSAVRAGAEQLARTWKRDAHIFLVYDGHELTDETSFIEIRPGLWERRSFNLRRTLGATFIPFAVVTDRHGTVAGKGLVNEIGHLESLLELEKTKLEQPDPLSNTKPPVSVVVSEVQHGSTNA